MRNKIIVLTSLLASLVLISVLVSPSIAFVYPDGSQDDKFESFGPRVDKVLIKKYAGLDAELQALQNGEIDITDMGLNKAWIDALKSDPNITMLGSGTDPAASGPRTGYYTTNFNNNDNEYLGNPEDPLYSNPVYPNPMSELAIRQACSYFIDRAALCSGQNEGLYESIYTPIPAYMKYWINPDIKPAGTLENLTYPFDPTYSVPAALLEAGGFLMGPDGWRYWDRNTNGIYDAGEGLNITIYSRTDALRKVAADMLCAGLDNPAIKIHYTRIECTGSVAWQKVMIEKDYHVYTTGWIFIGPDPDYLYDLYHWDNYYHPEDPPNFGAISKNDPVMQEYLKEAKSAATSEDALAAVLAFQERFAEFACECPLASAFSPKAFSKLYTGGNDGILIGDAEDAYRGHAWTQVVNEAGQGENSAYTTLNAYPEGFEYGDGNMIMRYGWSDNTMPRHLNPLSSDWYWEGEVIDRIYEHLFSRNPATQGPSNSYSVLQNWTLGTWTDPRDGQNYSKITVVIRPGIFWSDGVPFTIDDVIYNIEELPEKLPPTWFDFDYVEGFRKLDEYSVEFLMNVDTYLAPNVVDFSGWGFPLVPKHIWQSYIATHQSAEFLGDLSGHPELLVGTGPFVFTENTADTLTLVRNPYFHQRMSTAAIRFDEQGYRHGITVTALSPSTQISSFKIKVDLDSLGHACIAVPVQNLDADDECFINKRIELVCPNTTVMVLKDEASVNIQAAQMLLDDFDPLHFDPGKYIVKVTVEIVGGPIYEWVIATLPSELWPSILGPKTVEQCFWVSTRADINSDLVVDIFDITIVATVFGSTIGSGNFNGIADLNGDYVVDIFDIVQIALSFGWGS
jgi:ABC-type transport system substrate-binding protein